MQALIEKAWRAVEEEEQERIKRELAARWRAAAELLALELGGKDPYGIYSDTVLLIGEPAVPYLLKVALTPEYPDHAQAAARHAHAITGRPVEYKVGDGRVVESELLDRLRARYLEYHPEGKEE